MIASDAEAGRQVGSTTGAVPGWNSRGSRYLGHLSTLVEKTMDF
jgi:hypothetical protein